jgi:hypothetical protein
VRVNTDRWASSGPDFSEAYLETAQQLARRYAIMEGVVGVALVGGLTFGEADRYGDVDLIVYLQQQSLRTWYFGEAPLPEGESRYHGLRLDASYRDYDRERERAWSPIEIWRASRSIVLYDPEQLLSDLFASKIPRPDAHAIAALDRAAEIRYLLDRKAPGWLYRGEALAAHQVLNLAVDQVVGLLYLVNGEVEPEPGWDLALIERLDWLPAQLTDSLRAAMNTGGLTIDEATPRRYALQRLLRQCWDRIAPGDPFEERADAVRQARMLRSMVVDGVVTLDEWRERYDPRLLIQSPAYELLTIERQANGAVVRFNHDRLQRLVDHELGRFLDNQQRLLRELAEAAGADYDS